MKAGWKSRIDERRYFEDKKMSQRRLTIDSRILAIAQEEDAKAYEKQCETWPISPYMKVSLQESMKATNYFRKLINKVT